MSKHSRMLLVIGLFAIIAVVVLALMAQRYSALINRQAAPAQSEIPAAVPDSD
jgi:Na+-translocating ferredoxin:NAD+ oxidoreductase RnfG subunit